MMADPIGGEGQNQIWEGTIAPPPCPMLATALQPSLSHALLSHKICHLCQSNWRRDQCSRSHVQQVDTGEARIAEQSGRLRRLEPQQSLALSALSGDAHWTCIPRARPRHACRFARADTRPVPRWRFCICKTVPTAPGDTTNPTLHETSRRIGLCFPEFLNNPPVLTAQPPTPAQSGDESLFSTRS